MPRWIPPNVEKIKSAVTWMFVAAWGLAGLVGWPLLNDRGRAPDGALLVGPLAAAGFALLACMWGTARLVDVLFRLLYGRDYQPMDQARYDRAVIADVQRKDTIERGLRR